MGGMADAWLMLAFAPAPGYLPAKSGKSWYRKLATRDQAIAAKRELVAAGISYKCVKVQDDGRALRKPRSLQRERKPYRPVESRALRAQRDAEFADHRTSMTARMPPPDALPEPRNGPVFGRSPGLSKSGAPARHVERPTYVD